MPRGPATIFSQYLDDSKNGGVGKKINRLGGFDKLNP